MSMPRTSLRVVGEDGGAVVGFPVRFVMGEGLEAVGGDEGGLREVGAGAFEGVTGEDGEVGVSYQFRERQPAGWRVLFFGATVVPNREVQMIPLRELPEGAVITVGMPNP